jgi:osmotically-inducible protein OsmY
MGVREERIAEKETTASKEDHELGQKIIRNLKMQAVVDFPSPIQVWVDSGVAHLYGAVLMHAEKQMLEEIVRSTKGVVSVCSHLEIIPCSRNRPLL